MTHAVPQLTETAGARVASARRWWALVTACLGMMVSFLTITSTVSTLTPMQEALHASAADVVWVASIYTMVVACLVLTAATVGDILGRRRVFLAGVVVMAAGSLVVVLAGSTIATIAGQAVIGVGGAMVLPNSLAIVTHLFTDHHERTAAVSIWAAVSGVGLAVGPVMAGVLLEWFSWHSVFVVNIVIAAIVVPLSLVFVPEGGVPGRRLDPVGLVLAVVSIGALNYGVIQGGNDGFGSAQIVVSFVVAAVAAAVFVVAEARNEAPMLHLTLFSNRSFSVANAAAFVAQFSFVGLAVVQVLYFEKVDRDSILSTGLRLLALMAVYVVVSALASRVVRAAGFRVTIATGLVLAGAGALLLLVQGPSTSFTVVAFVLALFGVGVGLILPPATAAAVISVPHSQAGMASGAVNTFRQVGGALGAAILGTVLTSGFASGLPGELVKRGVPAAAARSMARAAASGGSESSAPSGLRPVIDAAAADSFTTAIHHAVVIPGAAALVMTVVAALFIHARPSPASQAPAEPGKPSTGPSESTRDDRTRCTS